MKQRNGGVPYLAIAGAPRHLQMSFDQMRHRATNAAMTVTQETTMGVERHFTLAAEVSRAHPRSRLAAPPEPKVFQQHRQGYRKAVIDRRIAHLCYRYARGFFRPLNRNPPPQATSTRPRRI